MPTLDLVPFGNELPRVAVVVGRFNDFITERLLYGALETYRRAGGDPSQQVDVAWVPGAWEIPLVCRKLAETGRYEAVVALGCVIRGGTPHFEYVAGECAKGLSAVGAQTGLPVIFGVLTTNSIEQAIERAGTKMGNKGAEAMSAALEMAQMMRTIGGLGRNGRS